MEEFRVSGEIQFALTPTIPADTKVYVRLLDTSVADAPAQLITEKLLTDVWQKANAGEPIPFTLTAAKGDERRSYTIAVLVDVDGDRKTGRGDFINMQSYPVHTFGNPDWVSVQVKEVT